MAATPCFGPGPMNNTIGRTIRSLTLMMLTALVGAVAVGSIFQGYLESSDGPDPFPWIVLLLTSGVVVVAYTRLSAFARKTSNSVGRMTEVALEIARGDLDRKIDTRSITVAELRQLGDSINEMADRTRHDIAELKRLERVRSEFLGNVSHELRTPIFSVQGYLETLIDGAADDPTVRDDFLQKAHQNVLRLHSLLTDLIEISRIESGEMKMSFRYFNAPDFLSAIIEELRPTAEMAGIALHLRVINLSERPLDDEVMVLGDRDRIKQVIVNLVENAIKYNRSGGAVWVELDATGTERTIRVRDTGIGIPTEDLGRIFERFYRVNRDRSRAVGGSGLGLAIVKHIVEKHGSAIQVTSEPGVGSTFSFSLKR